MQKAFFALPPSLVIAERASEVGFAVWKKARNGYMTSLFHSAVHHRGVLHSCRSWEGLHHFFLFLFLIWIFQISEKEACCADPSHSKMDPIPAFRKVCLPRIHSSLSLASASGLGVDFSTWNSNSISIRSDVESKK